jgi:hypothetical protein
MCALEAVLYPDPFATARNATTWWRAYFGTLKRTTAVVPTTEATPIVLHAPRV